MDPRLVVHLRTLRRQGKSGGGSRDWSDLLLCGGAVAAFAVLAYFVVYEAEPPQ